MVTRGFGDEILCAEHGSASHVVIHEGAHAVYTVNHGIDIREVRIQALEAFLGLVDGKSALAGGVTVNGDPKVWIPALGESALVFLLIGSVAEQGFFQHSLLNSDTGDRALWTFATGSAPTQEQIASAREKAQLEVQASEKAILALAREFRRILSTNDQGEYTGFDEGLGISAAEVHRIVSETAIILPTES